MTNFYSNKSLLGNKWKLKDINERDSLMISQRQDIPLILAKLLSIRQIKEDNDVKNFLTPDLLNNLPNPYLLKDMEKCVNKTLESINNKKKIGIITDYDVDGSTSAAILFNFLTFIGIECIIKVPERLNEGYGPNKRILDELIKDEVNLIFTLDCGTTSFEIFKSFKSQSKNIIVIDHHISEEILPDVFGIINPNRYDENNYFKELAAVGITFLFLLALRKKLREINFFGSSAKEPNLLYFLDLVALGTVCDVVKLTNYNRLLVSKGLDIIKKRTNKGIAQIIDNSKFQHTPTSTDLGFTIGPQLNAAGRLDDSSLSSRILISNNLNEIESISKKLILLNEKRKLIEKNIFEESLNQIKNQKEKKYILVYGFGWHKGVLGIIASKLVEKFNKPSFVFSLDNAIGIGSARSINKIDLGNIIIKAKNDSLLINGGGHKMAAGMKIKSNQINKFDKYLNNHFNEFNNSIFEKINHYDVKISINEINENLLNYIEMLEPFGNGNPEPKFIIHDLKIESHKIIKEKHLMLFFADKNNEKYKAICFNCLGSTLAENLINNKSSKYEFACKIKRDNFNFDLKPQLIIEDAIIVD